MTQKPFRYAAASLIIAVIRAVLYLIWAICIYAVNAVYSDPLATVPIGFMLMAYMIGIGIPSLIISVVCAVKGLGKSASKDTRDVSIAALVIDALPVATVAVVIIVSIVVNILT